MKIEFKLFLMLMLMLSFTGITQQYSSITVRVGDKVTLRCENGKDFRENCHNTTWTFSDSGNTVARTIFAYGEEHKLPRAKSGRRSLSADCSVVIRKVTYEDVGRYTCRQFKLGREVTHSLVDLSVITTVGIPTFSSNITARVGGDVTLPCRSGGDFPDKCSNTTWIFSDSRSRTPLMLVEKGQVRESPGAPSGRLSVTADCSLLITTVTYEDVGRYTCRQFISDRQVTDYQADLSLITMVTQQISKITVRVGDEVSLSCKNGNDFQDNCRSNTWLFNNSGSRRVETLFESGQILKSDRLSITVDCSLVIRQVTSEDGGLYACRRLLSGQFTDYLLHLTVINKDTTTTKTTSSVTALLTVAGTNKSTPTNMAATTQRSTPEPGERTGCWVKFIVVTVGLAALSITVLSVNIWTKRKNSKTSQGKTEHSDTDDDVNYENDEDFPAEVVLHGSMENIRSATASLNNYELLGMPVYNNMVNVGF